MMHIQMFADTAPPLYGGAGQQALTLATYLSRKNLQVDLLARQKRRAEPANCVTFARPYIPNQTVSSLHFAVCCFLRALLSRADVLHIHGGYYYAAAVCLAARIRRKPVVLKFTLVGSDDPATLLHHKFCGIPVGSAMLRIFRSVDLVIAISSELQDLCSKYAVGKRIVRLSNGVDMSPVELPGGLDSSHAQLASDQFQGWRRGSFKVVFLGDVCERKGARILLDSWAQVRDEHPDATLALVGPWSLESNASSGSAVGVYRFGSVPPRVARFILSEADVFVLPSFAEGLPNSVIEAMSLGVPCVVSDLPVHRELLSELGIYTNVSDASSLASGLCIGFERASSLDFRSRIKQASLPFSFENISQQYINLYLDVCRATGGVNG